MRTFQLPIFIVLSFIVISLVFSCVDEDSSIGSRWVESSFTNIQADTFTVVLGTILSDSLATSGDTVTQIGYLNDKYYGELTTAFFTEYDVPSYSFTTEEARYVYDSITFRFAFSGEYLGDTLTTQRIYMHELMQNIVLDDDGYLYNTTEISYDEEPLAYFDFTPRPGRTEEYMRIRLPDEWGEEWFNLMLSDERWMQAQDYFKSYFRGIAFLPSPETDQCISGIQVQDSSMFITVHYHQMQEVPKELKLIFTPSSTNNFTKVTQDRSNMPISDILSGLANEYPATKSNHQSYLQGLTGMYTTIDFPYLNNINEEGDMVTVESAILRLYPVRGTYDGPYPLPETLQLYTANEENVIQSVITNILGTEVQTGDRVVDEIFHSQTYYTFDLTSFLQTNLGTYGEDHQTLQLFLPDNKFYTTLEGIIFDDGLNSANTEHTQLIMQYKVYQK